MFGELTKSVGAVAVARLAGAGGALATQVLLAWMLSRQTNGEIQKAFVVVQMATLAGSLGIQTSLYYFLPRLENKQKRAFVVQSVALLTLLGVVFSGLIFLLAHRIAGWMHQPNLVPLLHAGALSVLAALPAMAAEPLFIAEKRPWYSAFNAIGSAGLQVLLVAVSLVAKLSPEMIFFAMAAASLVRLLPAFWFLLAHVPAGAWILPGLGLLSHQIAYILPVGLTSMVDTISSWLDRTLISIFYDAPSLATYSYGAIEIPFISFVIGSVMPVLLPRFSALVREGRHADVLEIWHRATLKGARVLFPLFAVFMTMAPELLATLYSPKYRDSSLYFRIYLCLLPVRIIAFMPVLFALGRRKYVLAGSVVEVLINLLLSVALITRTPLGMAGAAWGTVGSTLLQAWFYLEGIRGGLGVKWSAVLPWKALARELAGPVLLALPMVLLKFWAVPDAVRALAAGTLFAAYAWFYILPRLRAKGTADA